MIPLFRNVTAILLMVSAQTLLSVEIDQAIRAEMERFNDWYEKPELDTSAKTVLGLLKLDYPGLEKVRKAYLESDYDMAMEALLEYFRNDKKFIELKEEDTQTPYDLKLAEQTLNHVIKGNKNYSSVFRGTKIDWVGKAVIDGKVVQDVEWLYHYHRLFWWTFLAKAYKETGNEGFFYEWRYELVTYTNDILPIGPHSIRAVRRGMEAYYRCKTAMLVLPCFIDSDLFDAKLLRIYLAFFHHQAEHVRKVYADGGNHLLGEVTHVFINGLFFPEFKQSDEWIDDGLSMVPGMMKEMVFDEGMNKELVFSYHMMYCDLFYAFSQYALKNGYADRLPKGFFETIKGLHDIAVIALLPDGSTAQFGDAWKYRREKDGSFVPRYGDWLFPLWCERFPDEEHYRFLNTGGREGKAWDETCFRFEESGFHFFRNEWSPDAIYMALKYGPNARAHNQPDNGTFSLSAYGRDFMTDSGSYIYRSEDPEEQNWRAWFRRSASHQTLTLDGRDIKPDPEYLYWHNEEDLTVAVIENQSYPDLAHRRTVLFIDKSFFVIFDEAKGTATGDVRVHFQLDPLKVEYTDDGMTVYTDMETGPNLLLKAFPQTDGVVMDEEEGWVSYLYKHKQERPAFVYQTHKDDRNPVHYLTAIVPVDGAVSEELRTSLEAQVIQQSENSYRYKVSMGNQVWDIQVVFE